MQIGRYKLTAINSGFLRLDGGAMFGIIPKPLWQKKNPPDDQNRVKLATRCLLLQRENRNILIDTGMGDKWDDKSKKIYCIDQMEVSLDSELMKAGLSKEDITDVILTHLHFDHAGGSTTYINGRLEPAFPNARYYVQKQNYDWAVNPSERDRKSYIPEDFMLLKQFGILDLINGDINFDQEISFIKVNGHTFGQQLIKISDGSTTMLYSCDLFPFISHIHLPYIMGYDLQPLVTLEEKKKLLAEAADNNWILFFEHDPQYAAASVVKTDKGFEAENLLYDLC